MAASALWEETKREEQVPSVRTPLGRLPTGLAPHLAQPPQRCWVGAETGKGLEVAPNGLGPQVLPLAPASADTGCGANGAS